MKTKIELLLARPVAKPTPLFTKLDEELIEAESLRITG